MTSEGGSLDSLGWLSTAWSEPREAIASYPADLPRRAPHGRLVRALAQHASNEQPMGPADLVALVRSVSRHEGSNRSDGGALLRVPKFVTSQIAREFWASASVEAHELESGFLQVRARPWLPSWLVGSGGEWPPEAGLYEKEPRRRDASPEGDPFLSVVGFDHYASQAQQEAARTVLAAPAGSTILVNLPTGSGKTLCALLPAVLPSNPGDQQRGVTPIVVPTVALALDLEKRLRPVIAHDMAYRAGSSRMDALKTRCGNGVQGPVFLSPEALVGPMRHHLRRAAERGLMRCFAVDEAHMVTAWGDEFRPAFQQIAAVRAELLEIAGENPFATVLMSATLSPYDIRTLQELFGSPGPMRHVHAVRLRPEPSYWFQQAESSEQKRNLVLEALWHLPRPLILYTTKRDDAKQWKSHLVEQGFRRVGLMHGESRTEERDKAIDDWTNDRLDVMVATSAFGLGVDKSDVRAVIHATLPETINRYYQEVGRGGRDGFGCLGLTVWTKQDGRIAAELTNPKFITLERGLQRWRAMFGAPSKQVLSATCFELPVDVPPSNDARDMDMQSEQNEKWNVRTLLLLRRAGVISFVPGGESDADVGAYGPKRVTIQVLQQGHTKEALWQQVVEPKRQEFLDESDISGRRMRQAASGDECLATILADTYTSKEHGVPVVRSCGGCVYCRRHGLPARAGRLVARQTPEQAWPAFRQLGEGLQEWLNGERLGVVLYPERIEIAAALDPLFAWMCKQGIVNFVKVNFLASASGEFSRACAGRRVFLHNGLPRDILRDQHTAILIDPSLPDLWKEVWPMLDSLKARSQVTLLVLPIDLRQPDRPDRLVRDILMIPARLKLDQWEETYAE